MLDKKRASFWPIVVATGLISGGAGWIAAKALPLTQPTGAEVVATVQQIRAQLDAFSGKRVRLTGQLNECYGWECSLCPETMTSKDRDAGHCLALNFRPLVNGTGFGSSEQENVFRFSSVILTATFDPSCWQGGCVDRPTVLEDATVEAVTKRRAGASGLWVGNTTKLTPINRAAAAEIRAAALQAGYPDNPPMKAFTTIGSPPRLVVCWTSPAFSEHDPGAWPSTLESALFAQSTLDFFQCNEVRNIDGQMVVQAKASGF